MKRLLLGLVCACLASAAWAIEPFVVRDIRVEGIQRIEAGTVFSYLPIKVGDTVNDDKAEAAIKALFATGFFRDVRLERDGNVLVVSVQERPSIASIDFVGMKEFKPEDVRKALREAGIAEGRTFDRAQIEGAEQEIKKQYLSRGRYGAIVKTTVTPLERNRVGINFTIDEGDTAKIAAINIVGNQAFSERELLDQFTLRSPGAWTWYTKNDQYSRQKLQADLETLRSFYLNRGYIDFNIDSTQVSITPDKREVFITVNLTEGERYTVTDVKLAGELIVPESELKALITLKPGETFSRAKLAESTKAISERLGNEGYAFANANAVPDVDRAKRTVGFTIMVDPGRRVYVRRINIVGNTKTRDEVVRREMRQLEGAYYDGQRLQLSRSRIERLGYFSETDLETEPVAGTSDQVDVTVKVKERPTGSLMMGVGFSNVDRFILSASISQQNLFGTGKSLSVSVNSGQVNRIFAISYTDPYFTVNGVSQGYDIYDRRFDSSRLTLGRYRTDTRGSGIRFGYPVSEHDRINFGLAAEQVGITVFDDSPQRFIDFVRLFGDAPNSVITSAGWIHDTRDSAIWPTKGTVQRISGERTLDQFDLHYYKTSYQGTWFTSPTRNLTFMLNTEYGYASGYGGDPLPFFKAFYAGGPTSVRGFMQSSLGPRDANGVLGGTNRFVGNLEMLMPLPGMGQDRSVRLSAFYDVGQVWTNVPGYTLNDLKFRYSTGLAFNWNSPFGPLKLIYAFPLHPSGDDRLQRFQFLFGQVF